MRFPRRRRLIRGCADLERRVLIRHSDGAAGNSAESSPLTEAGQSRGEIKMVRPGFGMGGGAGCADALPEPSKASRTFAGALSKHPSRNKNLSDPPRRDPLACLDPFNR